MPHSQTREAIAPNTRSAARLLHTASTHTHTVSLAENGQPASGPLTATYAHGRSARAHTHTHSTQGRRPDTGHFSGRQLYDAIALTYTTRTRRTGRCTITRRIRNTRTQTTECHFHTASGVFTPTTHAHTYAPMPPKGFFFLYLCLACCYTALPVFAFSSRARTRSGCERARNERKVANPPSGRAVGSPTRSRHSAQDIHSAHTHKHTRR